MKQIKFFGAFVLTLGLGFGILHAQEVKLSIAPASFASGFRNDCLEVWGDFTKKMVALAEAMPEEKYNWRPGEGVRSVGEVFTHVASGNYFILQMAGVQPPQGVDIKMVDSVKGKAKIIEALKQSCEFARQSLASTSDEEFNKPAKIFGQDRTVREAYFLLVTHSPEHLGQSIAYARMNGIVPPWTAERQAQQQQGKK